ncbi:unnamed protein product, partial [Hapterophycus canaliculatus]
TPFQVNLGVLYLSGQLPGREQGEALECFQKAADQGDLSGESTWQSSGAFRTGLWNLSLCYERGVGVAKDVVVAQALQQQCRDREMGVGISVADRQPIPGTGSALGHPRRSSDPSAAVGDPARNDIDNAGANRGSNNNSESTSESSNASKLVKERRRSSRRRSSSGPLVTPPPPEGAPPPAATRGQTDDVPQSIDQTAVAAKSRKPSLLSKKPYKYVPKDGGPLAAASPGHNPDRSGTGSSNRRRETSKVSNGEITAGAGNRRSTTVANPTRTECIVPPHWAPPPPRERKDSFLLKPTPEAIARVKAAVERRKKLQAVVASASSTEPAKASAQS